MRHNYVCAEVDFSGALVSGTGLDEKHREDFLFGAAGIPRQGTGKATDGRYIRLQAMTTSITFLGPARR